MKTVVLYILLFTYATNLVKPVLPYVSDAVAHVCWYADHVSKVHYENGRYHVHLEALREAKKADNPKAGIPGKEQQVLSEHLISVMSYQRIPISSPLLFRQSSPARLLAGFVGCQKIPPRLTV